MPESQRFAIQTHGLTKNYGTVKALDGLDLTVREGEVHGFLGPNGAGKSTTMRVLLGLVKPDTGTARLLGGDPWTDAVALHREIAGLDPLMENVLQRCVHEAHGRGVTVLLWVLLLAVPPATVYVTSIEKVYPDQTARAALAASIMASPAQRALYGQVYNDSLGATGVWKAGIFQLFIAVAVILTVIAIPAPMKKPVAPN